MEVKVEDIQEVEISGVKVKYEKEVDVYKDSYFEWTGLPIVTEFQKKEIMAGILQGWHHVPMFEVVEYHEDRELFYFSEGTALMLFVDIENNKPIIGTSKIVRIPKGTEMEIEKGKGHSIAVAEGDCFKAIVVSPKQDAKIVNLDERIEGLQ